MTKEEKIKEAYGQYWEERKEYVDENGWDTQLKFYEIDREKFDTQTKGRGIYITRPKYLQGIENNNGWIRIESEDDLPKETNNYWVVNELGISMRGYDMQDHNHWEDITHYQPIEKPEPPIY